MAKAWASDFIRQLVWSNMQEYCWRYVPARRACDSMAEKQYRMKMDIGRVHWCILNWTRGEKSIPTMLSIIGRIVKVSSMKHFQMKILRIYGKMKIYRFIEKGEYLGTRQLGAVVRNELLHEIHDNDKVCLDFSGVEVVSNSFADECIAKLLLSMSLEELRAKTTFRGLNAFAQKNIAVALSRRYQLLQQTAV